MDGGPLAAGRIPLSRREDIRARRWLPWLALALAAGAHVALLAARQTATTVSGDEGTFLAMAESLAKDGDLEFGVEDRARVEAHPPGGRRAVILQRVGSKIAYSKPAVYPLLGALPFGIAGQAGLVALNVMALAAALWLAAVYLGRSEPDLDRVRWVLVTFAGTSVILSYVVWTMSDSLQASLVVAGLVLCLASERGPRRSGSGGSQPAAIHRFLDSSWAPVAGVFFLACAAGMRYPNVLIGVLPVTVLAARRRFARAAITAAALGAALFLVVLANQRLEGAPIPHKALRATFNPAIGYPVGEGAEDALAHFEAGQATERMGLVPQLEPRVSAYAALYFLIGRHTGVLIYFPVAFLLLWAALRKPDAVGWILLLGAAGLIFFHLVWMPRNYFGGATFVGNRYFLTTYALLLLAPRSLPSRRAMAVAWSVAAVVFVSAIASASRNRGLEEPSQSHAYAGVFRLLPYESTAPALDGRRDRYWSDELVRFVDPHARVEEHGFRLRSDASPTELVVASGRTDRTLRFLVQADHPDATLVVRDWLRLEHFPLTPDGQGGSWAFVEAKASPPLRRHPYWWDLSTSLEAWVARLSLETADGTEAGAEIRYFGPYRLARKFYAGEAVEMALPRRGKAGRRQRIPIRLRNAGWRHWASRDSVPIHLGYRLWPLPRDETRKPFRGPITPLERVEPGGVAELEMAVRWPRRVGRYEMTVDLVIGGHRWFEEWTGIPLARSTVRLVEPEAIEAAEGPG